MFETDDLVRMRRALLEWYDCEGRSLPWRVRPEDRAQGVVADPYAVWLSEIMLQQTTVPHATPYWLRFLDLWPSVEELAAAPRDDVLREWAGLGYYARARNLHACAGVVANELGGRFPEDLDGLRALPGIGDYTANAIRAAAFNKPASVVDGNVERVMTRVHRIQTPLPKAKTEIKRIAAAHADTDRPGDYAQAIMDLGATICAPKTPNCERCPWAEPCQAKAAGDMLRYPLKEKKKPKPVRRGTAWLVRRGRAVWLRTRPDDGLLGGMTEVPSSDWSEAERTAEPPHAGDWTERGEIKHVFTHFELRLAVKEAIAPADWHLPDGYWAELDQLDSHALPSVMRKVLGRLSGGGG